MRPLRIGTDCSGIEAPIQALKKAKIPFHHVFSSEIDKFCIESIDANYSPDIIFDDISKRNIRDIPDIDVYVCGFPCQPFSSAGKRRGMNDPKRGTVFDSCLEVIRVKKPLFFLLENVKGLLTINDGRDFEYIMDCLKELPYRVDWKLLNTKDYGIPQNRERVFIVGIRKSLKMDIKWPEPIPLRKKLSDYIDWEDDYKEKLTSDVKYMIKNVINPDTIFVNTGFRQNTHQQGDIVCPCITTANSSFICVPLCRKMNVKEMLMLQGFPCNFKQVVSDTQMKKQIGNSMSVNVLKYIFISMLKPIISKRSKS